MDVAATAAMQAMRVAMSAELNRVLLDQQAAHAIEIAELKAAILRGPAAAAPAGPRPVTERLAVVPDYDGVKGGLEEWFKLMERQFAFYGTVVEAERLRSAAGHLVGPALDWWNLFTNHTVPATWALFKTALELRFQPVTTVEAARAKLLALRQGTGTVNAYVAAFRNLVAVVPNTDAAMLRHLFTQGLNAKAREQVVVSNVVVLDDIIAMSVRLGALAPGPASGHSAMDLGAVDDTEHAESRGDRAELVAEVLAALDARQSSRGNSSQHGGHGRGAQGASGGHERRRSPRGLPEIKGLTTQQVEKYMQEGRCFGCNLVGHRSSTCPTRTVAKDGRVSWATTPKK